MKSKHYYGFKNLPNYWVDDNDRNYDDEFFNDKDYEDLYFDNFYDMDEIFGSENSLFGTRGLPVGHPDRNSKSFDRYNSKFGPMIVRVVKNNMNLQESIRKVLREESKAQKKMMRLIDEFGLYETSKMVGTSMTKLVQLSNLPINSVIANKLLIENMFNGNLPRKYNHFNIYNAGDGVVGWYCNISTGHFQPGLIEQISVMATPFWDGQEYTPVEIDWFTLLDDKMNVIIEEEGGGDYYKELKHQTSFENVEELFNWYKEFYLPEVYNIVMNKLLPIVHSDIDDRLN